MSSSTDYCNEFEPTKQTSEAAAQESSKAGHYTILQDQTFDPPKLYHNIAGSEKKCDLTQTYEELDIYKEGEGSTTKTGDSRESAMYTTMSAPVVSTPGPLLLISPA